MKRNVMLVWVSTLGMPKSRFEGYQQSFAEYFFTEANGKAYKQALVALQAHQDKGDDVYIISGAAHWLLSPLCEYLEISEVGLVGTSTKWYWGGVIMDFHCYRHNKVTRLNALGVPQQYQQITGYSDSAADIPMLKLCHDIKLINPRAACLDKFQEVFGPDVTCLQWD